MEFPERTSSYHGVVRVKTVGSHSSKPEGAEVYGKAWDMAADGNGVYIHARAEALAQKCTSMGFSHIIEMTASTCATGTTGQVGAGSSPEFGTASSPGSQTFRFPWCDQNGNNCYRSGFKLTSGACAQMGWPVPDSCTYAYVSLATP